jgi:5-methylcytosine-specific restriction endonuclease McrA
MIKISSLDKNKMIELLEEYSSITKILEYLGYSSSSGGGYKTFVEKCKNLKVDYKEYLKGKNEYLEFKRYNKINDILIENSPYKNRSKLKLRLIKEGLLEYKCGECDNKDNWNGKKLTLQLDHKNGINNDNRLENLRFLCPNCHSQTENYAGKNNKIE